MPVGARSSQGGLPSTTSLPSGQPGAQPAARRPLPTRALRATGLALLSALSVVNGLFVQRYMSGANLYDKDFLQDYLLLRAFVDRADPYLPESALAARYRDALGLFDTSNPTLHPTPHPPTLALFLWPLAGLPYEPAVHVWFALQLVCLVVGIVLAARAARLRIPPAAWPLVFVLIIGWAPLALDLGYGQLTLPILVLIAAALCAPQGKGQAAGGALLGASLLLKPLAWPWLLVFAWRRSWAALAAAAAVVLSAYLMVALVIGVEPIWRYVTWVLPSMSSGYRTEPSNISLWTVGPKLFATIDPMDYARLPVIGSVLIAGLLPAALLAACCWWMAATQPDQRRALAVMTCAAVLLSPISWEYDLVLGILPACFLVALVRSRRAGGPQLALYLALAVVLVIENLARFTFSLEEAVPVTTLAAMVGATVLMTLLMVLHGSVDKQLEDGRALAPAAAL